MEVASEAEEKDHEVNSTELIVTDSTTARAPAVEYKGVSDPPSPPVVAPPRQQHRQWKTTNTGRLLNRRDKGEEEARREPTTWNGEA